eukprot:XP_011670254.1 PREDICTED: RNA-directed DNA polymerase from mobile element jockey-like [Strongylocentrotus purpuratus]
MKLESCTRHDQIETYDNKPSLDTNGLKNYRPIANLPFLGKVLERIVSLQLKAHIDNLGLFPIHQSAYRNHHSTETATVKVLNDLLLAVDKGNEAVLILLDYTAAFDTINHDLLLHRLENDFSITGTVLQWICSYLMHRTQKVIINDTNSESFPLICGVPQGSKKMEIPLDTITALSKAIDSNENFADFGFKLGVLAGQIAVYEAQNSKPDYNGTQKMLHDWQGRTKEDQKTKMRTALQESNMGRLADEYLAIS